MSQALARSSPRSRPYSQSVCQGARLTAHPVSSPLLSVLTNHVAAMDLLCPMLTEPVSQQSVAVAARCFGKQELVLPLSTVLSVTMTQIFSTLASLTQWAWHPGHTPAFQAAPYPTLTYDMSPPDLLQELVLLLAPDTAAFLTVFSPLVQHCQQEAAST